jgi:hypothetical protein
MGVGELEKILATRGATFGGGARRRERGTRRVSGFGGGEGTSDAAENDGEVVIELVSHAHRECEGAVLLEKTFHANRVAGVGARLWLAEA